MSDLRVLIAADDPLARAGLAALLANEPSVVVIGQVDTDNALLDAFTYDIALIDPGWDLDDELSGLTDAPVIEADVPLLLLLPDDALVEAAQAALLSAGRTSAYGILERSATPNSLVAGLNAIAAGLVIFDADMAARLSSGAAPNLEALDVTLTPREREVLDLLAEGLPNKTIARELTISEYTVKFHVNAILTKLGAGSRTEAVVRATRLGLITL